jgi:glycosyltransferase involved in cell wall biosynthesis
MGSGDGLAAWADSFLVAHQEGGRVTVRRRLLLLTRYGPTGASSRLRMLQFIPILRAAGFVTTVRPFFDDAYLRALYGNGRRRYRDVAAAYLRRAGVLLGKRTSDLIWIEKEVFPFLPGLLEALLGNTPYVVDFDDATFHTYDLHRSAAVRRWLGRKLVPLLTRARAVTAGNAYLAGYAERVGARTVHRVATVVDLDRYPMDISGHDTTEFRIGWIGSPSTSALLKLMRAPLERLARELPVRLVTIGAGRAPDIDVPAEVHPWSLETEARLLMSTHAGIMPLQDEPWQRGKCGYKLIQYMACGKPVVASPVGVNSEIVTEDVGFLAATDDEWYQSLRRLATDRALGGRLGRAGRSAVEEKYSLQAVGPQVGALLTAATEV